MGESLANYVVYHLHSDLSNPTTTLDSVTKFDSYIEKAKQLGMNALAFSEHGNIFEWKHKKDAVENAGMKYIHACEAYVTKSLQEKIRDNYHVVLIAKNFDGVLELNELMSYEKAYNRDDGHFYYNPRITYAELKNTSDNIIITSACLGSILNSDDKELKIDFVKFMQKNKHRCFLEIQHHNVKDQINYNKLLYKLHKKTEIPLIAGTDTHNLNEDKAEARIVLQKAKKIHFGNEDGWDLNFHSYNELIELYKKQNSLNLGIIKEAIENTNVMANMIEEFELDKSNKYPNIYDNPEEVFKQKIAESLKNKPQIIEKYGYDLVKDRVNEEFKVYKKTGSIEFMLYQLSLRKWEWENDIYCGYSRGSVSGSFIAYILGITEMDSIRFDLNFFRFMNPDRVSLADIDSDYSDEDRKKVKEYLFNQDNLYASEIITFNTIALKGAIRDVGRAFEMPLSEVDHISKNIESNEKEFREKYEKLFKYVDLLIGTIVSVGTHPSGVLISPINISSNVGTCSLSTTENPVSCMNMKELDSLNFTKLDILGLDNVGVINKTCEMVGIDRLNPDNVDLEDINVWESIRENTISVFQWESESAQNYLQKLLSNETIEKIKKYNKDFSMIKLFSFGNGLIRPACASYRNNVANGEFYDNGLDELNEFLVKTAGHVTMQEDIMKFLSEFCGYSMGEGDIVRRAIGKKKNTEELLPEIESRFIEYSSKKYNISKEKCKEVIKPFLQVVLDATSYAFSWNHSDSYSILGYICGYLRYYYPLEFLTCALNVWDDDEEKTARLVDYANSVGIKIRPIKFGKSTSEYSIDKNNNLIYKGMKSIKYMNDIISEELNILSKNEYKNFIDLLIDIKEKTSVNSRQLDILIKLNYFRQFGKSKKLINIVEMFDKFYNRKSIKKDKLGYNKNIIESYSTQTDKTYKNINWKAILYELAYNEKDEDITIPEMLETQIEYLGYTNITIPNVPVDYAIILDIGRKYKHPNLKLYRVNNGDIEYIKVSKDLEMKYPLKEFDMIKTIEKTEKPKWIVDGETKEGKPKFKKLDETQEFLTKYSFVYFD